ncbi:MAG: hypothetical protein QXU82_02825, partial [Candidatus Aenigmatarchaeota archaeon]
KGVFNGTELEPLMSVVEEAKSTIVDELDIELADAKKLVDLNLLSPWTGRQAFTSTASALILTTFLGRSAWIMLFSSREILANSAGTRRNFWRKKVF